MLKDSELGELVFDTTENKGVNLKQIGDNKDIASNYEIDNRELLNTIDSISDDVIKILIPEEYIISSIVYSILEKLCIVNKSIRIKLHHLIKKYINNKTEFYYDENTREVIGLALDSYKLKELFKELITFTIEDKYLQENSKINESKVKKNDEIKKILININKIDENLNELNQRLFQLQSKFARLEDKGEIDENIDNNISFIETSISSLLMNKEELILKKTELEVTINTIDDSLKELEEYKEYSIEEKMKILENEFLQFSFPYELKEINSNKDIINKIKISNLGGKSKKVIYSLAFLTSLGLLTFIDSIKNNKNNIIEYSQDSLYFNNEIPKSILNEVSKGSPRIISGFEDCFVFSTRKKSELELVFLGDTRSEDIILNTIIVEYSKDNVIQIPFVLKTYFYRKDIKNKDGFTIMIKDNSEDIRKINLKFKDKGKDKDKK